MPVIDSTPRLDMTTIDRHLRIKVEPLFRRSIVFQELRSRGRISYRNHSKITKWKVRKRRPGITAGSGTQVSIPFPQTNLRVEASLPFRHYYRGESISYFEKLANQNPETALFDLVADVVDDGIDDFTEALRLKIYGDGNAGAANELHGIESYYSVNGLVANSRVGNPNDNYAGLSTALGTDGSWTPDAGDGWPSGTGSTEYHYFSPLVVDYQNANWTGTTKNWRTTWQQAIRYLVSRLGLLQKVEPDLIVLNATLLEEAKNSLESNERFLINRDRSNDANIGPKTLAFEDFVLATEYGIPDAVGYAINFQELELMCMTNQLVEMMRDTDIVAGGQELFAFQFFGNLRCNSPAFQGKLQAISALGT